MSCCSSCLPTGSFCSPPKIFGRDLCMTPMKGSSDKIYIFLSIYYSTIYCATQNTLTFFQAAFYVLIHRNIIGSSNSLYFCRTTGTTFIFVGLQQYSQV